MSEHIEKMIDIEAVLKEKMGGKARFVPRFVVNWLKHIAHEDLVNQCLTEHKDKHGVEWIDGCVDFLGMQLTVAGKENLPSKDDGRLYTFVSNHPLGGIDGLALGSIIGHQYDGGFRYLVNDLLLFLPGFADLSVGINKTGAQGRDFPKRVEAVFDSPNHVLMFPAGLCSRRIDGKIHDIPWKKAFISKSVQHERDVVPIHFSGQNSTFFYRLASLCKRLGIRFNVAMLFLVDEMYKNMNKPFTVTIGKPIPWQTFDKSKTSAQWAQWVEDQVYELPNTIQSAPQPHQIKQ
ncbi:MAG: glycerol acyltransferase [Prevotella sp.]|nr:glycerol acyltransferase [Prevotella sp.]